MFLSSPAKLLVQPQFSESTRYVYSSYYPQSSQNLFLLHQDYSIGLLDYATKCVFDQVVVFDNKSSSEIDSAGMHSSDSNESGASFLVRILHYLETPQYLRKSLFPKQNDLRYVVCTDFS